MSCELLFEIGTEELPPKFVTKAREHLQNAFTLGMQEIGVDTKDWQFVTFGTPRRLAMSVNGIPEKQEDAVEELIGPPAKAAFDADGNPTKVALGFCKSKGVDPASAYKTTTAKGEYLAVKIERKGQALKDLVATVLHKTLHTMPAPKMMRWGDGVHQFVRPIHSMLALFNGEPIDLEFQGVKAGNESHGHRLMAPNTFAVKDLKSYLEGCVENCVIPYRELDEVVGKVDSDKLPAGRKEMIISGLLKLTKELNADVYGMKAEGNDPLLVEHYYTNLLDEVSQMVEFPKVVLGSFSEEYLRLPKEVILSELRDNQRCFAFIGANGKLLPNFACIADNAAAEEETIRRGNQRVIRARLSDAAYFFDLDSQTPLKNLVPNLKGIVFQRQLGTVYERSERVAKLAIAIGAKLGFCNPMAAGENVEEFMNEVLLSADDKQMRMKALVGRAALLAKADLVTKMVGEFPELQGIMGREYAALNKEPDEICWAVEDHYRPRFAGDPLARGKVGELVAIADKLDLICGIIGIGKRPSGSADPFALRRAANGVLRILVEKSIALNLRELVKISLDLLAQKLTKPAAEVEEEVISFFMDRFKNAKFVEGKSTEVVSAVVAANFDVPYDAFCRVTALGDIYLEESFAPVVATFKRVYNIIQNETITGEVDSSLFKDDVENDLFRATSAMAKQIESQLVTKNAAAYAKVFADMASLKKNVDNFFDKVMVNAEEPEVKKNRQCLLRNVAMLFGQMADFRELHH